MASEREAAMAKFREHAVEIVWDRPATAEEKVARGYTPLDTVVLEERIRATATAQGIRLADGELITGMAQFKARFPGAAINHNPASR